MNYERFNAIIKKNKFIENEVNDALDEFKKINIDGDSIKLMKEVGEELGVMVFSIPMKESDFGAVSYKTEYSKYILINTNQPCCKMNFSYYHDIYHIIRGSSNMLNESREVHLNEDYLLDDNECKANLFSACILMPDKKFKFMFKLYYKSCDENLKCTTYKLMNYFSSPYISVLLRICELKLIQDMKIIEEHLKYNEDELSSQFKGFGISDEILKPTLTDDSMFLYTTIEKAAKQLMDKGLIDKNRYERLSSSIVNLVEGIKSDGQNIQKRT